MQCRCQAIRSKTCCSSTVWTSTSHPPAAPFTPSGEGPLGGKASPGHAGVCVGGGGEGGLITFEIDDILHPKDDCCKDEQANGLGQVQQLLQRPHQPSRRRMLSPLPLLLLPPLRSPPPWRAAELLRLPPLLRLAPPPGTPQMTMLATAA